MSVSYVGSRTTALRNARGKGLSVWSIDDDTGNWTKIQTLKEQENPSYLTFDNTKNFLYSVHGDYTEVTSYAINPEDGKLTYINKITLDDGKNPVFITADKTNRYLLVATLQGGAVYVVRREENGALGEVVSVWRFPGKPMNPSLMRISVSGIRKKLPFRAAAGPCYRLRWRQRT